MLVVSAILVSGAVMAAGAGPAAAQTGPSDQGVTATTIRVGIPYIDLSAVRKFGLAMKPSTSNRRITGMSEKSR